MGPMDAGAGSGSWNGVGSSYHEDSKKSKWLLDFAQIARELTMKLHLGVTSGVGIHVTWMFVFWCLLICLVGDFVLRIRSHGTKITMKTLPFGWMFVNFSNHRRETNLGLIFWGGRKSQWPNLIFEDEDRVGWWWMFFFWVGWWWNWVIVWKKMSFCAFLLQRSGTASRVGELSTKEGRS